MKIEIKNQQHNDDDDEHILEIYRHHREVHIKYTYYLITVSAAAITFAIHKTTGLGFNISQIPLAIAVILWGLSFTAGCIFLRKYLETHHKNAEFLELKEKNENLRKEIDKIAYQALIWGEVQFYCLIFGGAFFLIWHLVEMGKNP